jgi:hypothetical protein
MVYTSDSLGEDITDFEDLELGASRFVFGLVDCIGHNDLVECASVDALDGVSAQDTVGNECKHLGRAFLLEQFRSAGDCVGSIRQIIDEDGSAVRDISDQHHGRILPVVNLGRSSLFVDERERHAERVGNGGRTLRTARVGTDDDGLLVVGDIVLDVFTEEVTAVQIVNGYVEKALILGI